MEPFSSVLFFGVSVCSRPLGGLLSICETPGRLRGLENVTCASTHRMVSSKWVEYRIWVNYPF